MRRRPQSCRWCGRDIAVSNAGRRRLYCRQSCRQRAYEHRNVLRGTTIPPDSVILSAREATEVIERWFAARCAAEDIDTALAEDADRTELRVLSARLVSLTRAAERFR